ncbi:MAG: GDSL-type esterase/lipase family protein [Eubacteriales bacterium]|nr:GDSL-type esterase/lipase family protein [Eubacteriales bacterium]
MSGRKTRLHIVILVILTMALLLISCSQNLPVSTPEAPEVTQTDPPEESPGAENTPPTTEPVETAPVEPLPPTPEETTPAEEPDPAITEQPEETGDPNATEDPDHIVTPPEGYVRQEPTGNVVPARTPVDNSFFRDAAFVGNSLVEGLQLFSGITECDYYAATSLSVLGVDSVNAITLDNGMSGTIIQGIAQKPYAKVYILLGINEIGCDVGYFKQAYGKMLDTICALQPDADIYIMSITPVSYAKSSTSDIFNMTRVNSFNNALVELAGEKGVWYLDLCEALAGPDGYLPAEVTSDGVHFSASQYGVWADYLRSHYV